MLPRLFQEYYRTIAVVSFILVGTAGWFFFIRPLEARIAITRVATIEGIAAKERFAEQKATFERLRSDLTKVSPTIVDKISRLSPKGRDVPQLLVELEALANETGLLLKDIGVSEGKTESEKAFPKGVKSIDLVITVSAGDYSTLKRFLDAVEKNVRLLNVKSFTFAKGLQSYIINVQAYYME